MTRRTKCRLLVIASILVLLIAIIFQLLSLKVSSSLDVFYGICINVAILSAIITTGYIISSGEIRKIQGIVLVLVYISVGAHIGLNSLVKYKNTHGAHHWFVESSQNYIQKIGTALLLYKSRIGHLPNSNDWCDLIMEQETDIHSWYFKLGGKQDNSCGFAFNDNLSKLSIDSLEPNTVLIFEADGPWNFAGGPEQFPGSRHRDKYFPRKEEFAYLFFVDGSLVKYRLHDGAVSLYDPDKDEFTDYRKKSETPYNPLRWK